MIIAEMIELGKQEKALMYTDFLGQAFKPNMVFPVYYH